MSKKGIIIGIIVILISSGYFIKEKYMQPNDEIIEATGTIEATTVDLTARLPGTIKEYYFTTGDEVKKENTVVALIRNDLMAQKERDLSSVEKAEAYLKDLQSGARKEELEKAEANVNIAKINLEQASVDLERAKGLYESSAITRSDLEKFQNNFDVWNFKLQDAEAALELLYAGSRPEQIEASKIEVERLKAVLKATEAMLEDTILKSSIDGVVLNKNYENGEYVQMGAAVATIADLNDLWINVYIPIDDLPFIKLGDSVIFNVSGMEKEFNGMIEEIATEGEFTPKTILTKEERTNVVFKVKIKIILDEKALGILKPGMPADVVFDRRRENDQS
ncbi:MAG: efflux RND transporter periplasmic adaptor subunit [Clostridia bacterium]|nr:efflux RND transporter periplasmic adaptor subunit [Clostridia bacterium]